VQVVPCFLCSGNENDSNDRPVLPDDRVQSEQTGSCYGCNASDDFTDEWFLTTNGRVVRISPSSLISVEKRQIWREEQDRKILSNVGFERQETVCALGEWSTQPAMRCQ
jgi:hypothetical protein